MRYQEPSIVEALCELRFVQGAEPWDMTVFGRFSEKVAGFLPRREPHGVLAFNFQGDDERVEQTVQRQARMRFFNQDKTAVAQVGENLLAVNVLSPYPHWDVFKKLILDVLEAYAKAASPAGIAQMTLRYIDRFTLPAERFRLGDWIVSGSPYLARVLDEAHESAFSRVQTSSAGTSEAFTVALEVGSDKPPALTFDTEISRSSLPVAGAEIAQALDEMHGRVVDIFEACISDRTREILKPEAA